MTNFNLNEHISIGELSELTGISTHSLRIWERRYGAPKSKRLPSGHRRYPKSDVPRLMAISKALQSGYRASKVVTGTLEELQGLMGFKSFVETDLESSSISKSNFHSKEMALSGLINAVHAYDDDYILNKFNEEWGRLGTLSFLIEIACPFLERIGKGWELNELSVSNEHFASECIVSFFVEKWRRMNFRKNGTGILIAGLPGEPYTLGTLMCALVTGVTNSKIIYIGIDNPIEDIISSANYNNSEVVTLSISHAIPTKVAEENLLIIRNEINPKTLIVTGGKGSPRAISGVLHCSSFEKYYKLLVKLNNKH